MPEHYNISPTCTFSMLECTIPEKWTDLKQYLNINGLDEVPIEGDGLCILNAICECAYMDYSMPLTLSNLQKQILDHLKLQGEKVFALV